MTHKHTLTCALMTLLGGAACVYAPADPFEGLQPGDVTGRVVVLVPGGDEVASGARVRLVGGTLVRTPDSNGRFVLRNIPEGTFTLELSLDADNDGTAEKAARVPLAMTRRGGELARVNLGRIVLSELGGITGAVRAPDGVDPAGTVVTVQGIPGSVPVAADGTFTLERLPGVGTYIVSAHREARPELGVTALLSRPMEPVVVVGGTVVTLPPLELVELGASAADGVVQGELVFPDGDTVANALPGVRTQGLELTARVFLSPQPEGWATANVAVNDAGVLLLTVPPGVYDVLIEFEPSGSIAPLFVTHVPVFPGESSNLGTLVMQVVPPECDDAGGDCVVETPDGGAPAGSSSAAPSSMGGSSSAAPSSAASSSSGGGSSSASMMVVGSSSAEPSSSAGGGSSSDLGTSSSAAGSSSSREPCDTEGPEATSGIARLARFCAVGKGVSFQLSHVQRVSGTDGRLVAVGRGSDAVLGGVCARVPVDQEETLLIRYNAEGSCEQASNIGAGLNLLDVKAQAGSPGRVVGLTGGRLGPLTLHTWDLETLQETGTGVTVLGTSMLTATSMTVTQMLPLSNGGVAFLLSVQPPVLDAMGTDLASAMTGGNLGAVVVLDNTFALSWMTLAHHSITYASLDSSLRKLEESSPGTLRVIGQYEAGVTFTTTTGATITQNTTARSESDVGLFTATFSLDGQMQDAREVPIFASGSSSGALPSQGLYELVDARNAQGTGTVVGRVGQQEFGSTAVLHQTVKGPFSEQVRTYGTTVVSTTGPGMGPGAGDYEGALAAVVERDPRAPAGMGAPDSDSDPQAHVLPNGNVLFFKNMMGVRRPVRVGYGYGSVNHVVAGPNAYSEAYGHEPVPTLHLFVVTLEGKVSRSHMLRPMDSEGTGYRPELNGVFDRADNSVDLWFWSDLAWELVQRDCSGNVVPGSTRVIPRGDSLVNLPVGAVMDCPDYGTGTDVMAPTRVVADRFTELMDPPVPERATLDTVGSRFVQLVQTEPGMDETVNVRVSQADGNSDACYLVDVELEPQGETCTAQRYNFPLPPRRWCVDRQFRLLSGCTYELRVRGYSDVPLPPLDVLVTSAPRPDNSTCAQARPMTVWDGRTFMEGTLWNAPESGLDGTLCEAPTGTSTVYYEIIPKQTGKLHLGISGSEVWLTEVDATCTMDVRCPYAAAGQRALVRDVVADVPFRVAVRGMAQPFTLTADLVTQTVTPVVANACGAVMPLMLPEGASSVLVRGSLPATAGTFTPVVTNQLCDFIEAPGQDIAFQVDVGPFLEALVVLRLDPSVAPTRTPVLYAMAAQSCTATADQCVDTGTVSGDNFAAIQLNNYGSGVVSYVVVVDSTGIPPQNLNALPYELLYLETYNPG